jgi:N-acetylneuraminic acid mutarotase
MEPFASNAWKNMNPETSPPARFGHAMAYDSENRRVVLFGGWNGSTTFDDTWVYDAINNTWTEMRPNIKPSPRRFHGMAYDAQSDRVILFGGRYQDPVSGNVSYLNDTWAFDLNTGTWTNMTPDGSPSPRAEHALAYDVENDRIILFGGRWKNEVYSETWSYDFDNNSWTNMDPNTAPSARYGHSIAYDPSSHLTILFGGRNITSSFQDTWVFYFNNKTWSNMSPFPNPPSRCFHAMTYDLQSSLVILFGGSSGLPLNDTWIYDARHNSWSNLTLIASPPARSAHAMVYDSNSDRIILFDGNGLLNDTWAYELGRIPEVLSTSPENGAEEVSLSASITIAFSEPMDRISTEGAFSISPGIPTTFKWEDTNKTLIVIPKEKMNLSTRYNVTIGTSAMSQMGMNMIRPYSFTFTTTRDSEPPSVLSTNPPDGATNVDPNSQITIVFSEPMNKTSVEDALSIIPGSINNRSWDTSGEVLTLNVSMEEGKKYIVKIAQTAEDLAGNRMKVEYTLVFDTIHSTMESPDFSTIEILLGVIGLILSYIERKEIRKMVGRLEKKMEKMVERREKKMGKMVGRLEKMVGRLEKKMEKKTRKKRRKSKSGESQLDSEKPTKEPVDTA